jgi:hypothetical protein
MQNHGFMSNSANTKKKNLVRKQTKNVFVRKTRKSCRVSNVPKMGKSEPLRACRMICFYDYISGLPMDAYSTFLSNQAESQLSISLPKQLQLIWPISSIPFVCPELKVNTLQAIFVAKTVIQDSFPN